MSVTNALSSVITAIIIAGLSGNSDSVFNTYIFGFLAIALAAINIFGDFLATQRMLAMYKKEKGQIVISANLSAIFYLISGVLFILALRGLSPETSRQGNFFGILGMIIAIIVTFLSTGNFSTGFIFVLVFIQ